jgi:hypothetical protein
VIRGDHQRQAKQAQLTADTQGLRFYRRDGIKAGSVIDQDG